MLSFLTVPSRKTAVNMPFKLPAGCVPCDPTMRKTLGARRRRPGAGGLAAFKKPTADALDELLVAPAEEEEEELAPPPAAEVKGGKVLVPGVDYERLVLWPKPKPEGEGEDDDRAGSTSTVVSVVAAAGGIGSSAASVVSAGGEEKAGVAAPARDGDGSAEAAVAGAPTAPPGDAPPEEMPSQRALHAMVHLPTSLFNAPRRWLPAPPRRNGGECGQPKWVVAVAGEQQGHLVDPQVEQPAVWLVAAGWQWEAECVEPSERYRSCRPGTPRSPDVPSLETGRQRAQPRWRRLILACQRLPRPRRRLVA